MEDDKKRKAEEEQRKKDAELLKQKPVGSATGSSTSTSDLALLLRRKPRKPFDASSMTSRPGREALSKLKAPDTVISLASDEALECIKADWVEVLKIDGSALFENVMDIVLFCVDNGSSAYTAFHGTSPCGKSREDLASVIKAYCTMRQFCSKYAPVAWNYMLQNERPPASWARRRVTSAAKYAAFDFFDAVCCPAAIQPEEGLVREPTDIEKNAAAILKDLSLQRDELRRGNNTTFFAEVTGGKTGAKASIKSLCEVQQAP
uniref:Capsid protein n=1 Tax=Mentha arvensis robigovirus 1 TaxID=3077297 RepID=A0AA96HIU6_9VIRU|nr:coat protein [Mentha arvensis robigovirus 1]